MSRALILGSANTLQADLEKAPKLDVIAVNDAGWKYPGPVTYWVTLHPENFIRVNKGSGCGDWFTKRPRDGYEVVSHKRVIKNNPDYVDHVFSKRGWWHGGSSGLLAVAWGLEHYDELILCGMPMDSRPHFWDDQPWHQNNCYWRKWCVMGKDGKPAKPLTPIPPIAGRVKSMSGWTKELLGAPEWQPAEKSSASWTS